MALDLGVYAAGAWWQHRGFLAGEVDRGLSGPPAQRVAASCLANAARAGHAPMLAMDNRLKAHYYCAWARWARAGSGGGRLVPGEGTWTVYRRTERVVLCCLAAVTLAACGGTADANRVTAGSAGSSAVSQAEPGGAHLVSADAVADPAAKDEPSAAFVQPQPLAGDAATSLASKLTTLPADFEIKSVSRGRSGDSPTTFAILAGPDGEVAEVVQQALESSPAVVMASAEDIAARLTRLPGGEAYTLSNSRYTRTYHVAPDGVFTVITVAYPEAREEVPRLDGAERLADELGAGRLLLDLEG